MKHRVGLNSDQALGERLMASLRNAHRFDMAVAYARLSGVKPLIPHLPPTRAVVGIGFQITEPRAVEELADAGAGVRLVVGDEGVRASEFHPKLYLVQHATQLIVFSGSANLTSGGLYANVEQYEELRMPLRSAPARHHRRRFENMWNLGESFDSLRLSPGWNAYTERFRELERERRNHARKVRGAATGLRRELKSRGFHDLRSGEGRLASSIGSFRDQRVAITGWMTNDGVIADVFRKNFTSELKSSGAVVTESVPTADYLIVGSAGGPKLNEARKHRIPLVSYHEARKLVRRRYPRESRRIPGPLWIGDLVT